MRKWLPLLTLGLVAADAPTERGLVPVGVAEAPADAPRRLWAVVVGVSDYAHADQGIPALQYADVDARAVAEQLRSGTFGGGIPAEQLLLLTDREATLENVRRGLFEFLAKAGRDDLVVVYFAGHGLPDPLRPQDTYLLVHDTHPEHLVTTGLSMDEVRRSFDRIAAERVVLFADACHSAALALPGVTTRAVDDNRVHTFLTELARTGRNRVVVTSSDADEVSFEGAQWGHGVFTWALLDALRSGDVDQDGIVRLGEAIDHLRDRVERETQFRQHPVVSGEYDARLPLAVQRAGGPGPAVARAAVPAPAPAKTLDEAVAALVGAIPKGEPRSVGFVDLSPVYTSEEEAAALGFHLRSSLEAHQLVVAPLGKSTWDDKGRDKVLQKAAGDHAWVFRGALGSLGNQRSLNLELSQVAGDEPMTLRAYELAPNLDALVARVDEMLLALVTDAAGRSEEEMAAQVSRIGDTIKRNAGQAKYCYERALKGNHQLAGRVELAWTLEQGVTTEVRVASNDTGDAAFAECLRSKAARWMFPADIGGEFTWPFVFKSATTPDGTTKTSTQVDAPSP